MANVRFYQLQALPNREEPFLPIAEEQIPQQNQAILCVWPQADLLLAHKQGWLEQLSAALQADPELHFGVLAQQELATTCLLLKPPSQTICAEQLNADPLQWLRKNAPVGIYLPIEDMVQNLPPKQTQNSAPIAAQKKTTNAPQPANSSNSSVGYWQQPQAQTLFPPKPNTAIYSNFPKFRQLCTPPQRTPASAQNNQPHLVQILPALEMGGADKFALDLGEWLPKHCNWKVSFLTTTPAPNKWLQRAAELGCEVIDLSRFLPIHAYASFLQHFIATRAVNHLLITHADWAYRALPWLARNLPEVSLVDYLHIEHPTHRNGDYPRLSTLYCDYLNTTLVSSQHLKNWCVQAGHQAEKISVHYTNIDSQVWHQDNAPALETEIAAAITNKDVPLLLVAMRLDYQKQPELMTRLLLRLEQAQCKFQAVIVGDGEKRAWLEDFLAKHNLQQTVYLGAVANSQVRALMAKAAIYLLPSQMEGIALALFEAMAMGAVPIAGDVGGQRELVTPDCGVLIQREFLTLAEEEQAYFNALENVLTNPQILAKLSAAARKRIESHFDIRHLAEGIADKISSLNRQNRLQLPERAANTTLAEAAEHCRLEWSAKEQKKAAKEQFLHRLAKRDQKIHRLEEKITQLQQSPQTKKKKFWWFPV